jgi:hypothetical protein
VPLILKDLDEGIFLGWDDGSGCWAGGGRFVRCLGRVIDLVLAAGLIRYVVQYSSGLERKK